MPGFLNVTGADFAAVAPEMVLAAAGMLLILLDGFAKALRPSFPFVSLLALAFASFVGTYDAGMLFAGAIEVSALTRFVELLTYAGTALAILGGAALLERDRKNQGEFYALLLWAAAGLILMVKGNDLLVVFVGLELMSLALYVLAAWYREAPASIEAGMKYFLVGALASTFLLFGVAQIYGRLGTTRLSGMQGLLTTSPALGLDPMLMIGVVCVIAALSFKIALFPFHSWAPDVYQGMTTPAVTFLSTVPKAGAVVVLVRFLHALAPTGLGEPWKPMLGVLAVLSILFGNIVALSQRDLKRMLAYSGIANMGYVAIGLAAFTEDAIKGVLVFLTGYLLTNAAAFLAVAALSNGEKDPHPLNDLAGLGRRHPLAAWILTISMLSLAGIPPTVGFIGKFLVFKAAVDANLIALALVGVLGSLISVGYYLRVVYYLWMREPIREVNVQEEDVLSLFAFLVSAAAMLVLGMFPGTLLALAKTAALAVK